MTEKKIRNRKPRKKSHFFAFTLFTTEFVNDCFRIMRNTQDTLVYFVAGHEKCPTTGRFHLQGYIVFRTERTEFSVRRLIPRAHIEFAKESPEVNTAYCRKFPEGPSIKFGGLLEANNLWLDKVAKRVYNNDREGGELIPSSPLSGGLGGSVTPSLPSLQSSEDDIIKKLKLTGLIS